MGYSENGRRVSCFSVASSVVDSTVIADDRRTSSAMRSTLSPLEKMVEIQSRAEFYLRSAIMNERARKWEKVVEVYSSLLKLISRPNMPFGFSLTDSYVMLIYESYYHLGLAQQNLGRHKEAVATYTQAIKAVNIHKNGCWAGCNSNSCFQTPVLAKRAFAHAKAGDIRNAFVDIEKAIVLDTRNPDLYCIRALLWNTTKDTEKAVDDLNRSLRYNPCHVCALLLRGIIDQPFRGCCINRDLNFSLRITFHFLDGLSLKNNEKAMKKDHVKAQQINPQAVQFLDVMDIHSSKMIRLWNRFLRSLNVPRNIVHPELMEGFNSGRADMIPKLKRINGLRRSQTTPVIQINGSSMETSEGPENLPEENPPRDPSKPFRCGTPTKQRDPVHSRRRHSYGEALRAYSVAIKGASSVQGLSPSRPQTANSARSVPTGTPSVAPSSPIPRPPSVLMKKRPSVTFARPLLKVPGNRAGTVSAPPSLVHPQCRRSSLAPTMPQIRRASFAQLPASTLPLATMTSASMKSKRDVILIRKRSASEYARKVHGMRVFEPLNITEAPRMYYKPWAGDKLPVADIKTSAPVGVFRV